MEEDFRLFGCFELYLLGWSLRNGSPMTDQMRQTARQAYDEFISRHATKVVWTRWPTDPDNTWPLGPDDELEFDLDVGRPTRRGRCRSSSRIRRPARSRGARPARARRRSTPARWWSRRDPSGSSSRPCAQVPAEVAPSSRATASRSCTPRTGLDRCRHVVGPPVSVVDDVVEMTHRRIAVRRAAATVPQPQELGEPTLEAATARVHRDQGTVDRPAYRRRTHCSTPESALVASHSRSRSPGTGTVALDPAQALVVAEKHGVGHDDVDHDPSAGSPPDSAERRSEHSACTSVSAMI